MTKGQYPKAKCRESSTRKYSQIWDHMVSDHNFFLKIENKLKFTPISETDENLGSHAKLSK